VTSISVERQVPTLKWAKGQGVVRCWARLQNSEKRILASSCLPARMEQSGSHWVDFHEILYLNIFRALWKLVETVTHQTTPGKALNVQWRTTNGALHEFRKKHN